MNFQLRTDDEACQQRRETYSTVAVMAAHRKPKHGLRHLPRRYRRSFPEEN
jgi:hypothetical protein